MPHIDLATARAIWGEATFVALDFETTGLDCSRDRIVEIGALRFGADGERASMGFLVDPGMPISPGASRVNGITDAMVRGKEPCDEAIAGLLEFIGKAVIVAHNAPFDVGFLKEAMRRVGRQRLSNRIADTRRIAKEAFPGRPSYALQALASWLHIAPGNAHRALDDARVCKELLVKAIAAPLQYAKSPTFLYAGAITPEIIVETLPARS